ncbi:MAG: DUF1428 domain-containing protein [Rhodovibrionaceae bacterium]
MTYVDGFVVPVPEDRIEDYRKMAQKAGEVWREHGALAFVECVADDVPEGKTTDFFRAVKREPGETVVFAYIVYESREARDAVMAKVMEDPRIKEDMEQEKMPFDGKRMFWGGFTPIVEL